METQLATKPQAGALANVNDVSAWQVPEMSAQDITLPKLLVMQKMSEAVDEKKAKEGDFIDSLSGKVLGNITDKPLYFVPIHMQIVWYIFEYDKKKKEWNYTAQFPLVTNPNSKEYNDKWKFEEEVNGVETRRERRMLFYVLNCAEPKGLPYVLTFKVTSARTGKNLATQMYTKNISMGLIPPARAFKLTGKSESNDKGTFIVPQVEEYRMSSQEEIAQATHWYKTILGGTVKIDDGDIEAPKSVTNLDESTAEF